MTLEHQEAELLTRARAPAKAKKIDLFVVKYTVDNKLFNILDVLRNSP